MVNAFAISQRTNQMVRGDALPYRGAMEMGQIDVAVRAGAVVTMLLLAGVLWGQRRRVGLPATLFLPLAVCIAGFVVGNTPMAALRPAGLAGDIAHALSGFTVVFLWWFCLSCFDSRYTLRSGVLAVGLIWVAIASLDRGLLGDPFTKLGLSRLLVPLGFGIVGHLVWRLLSERQDDLIQRRHDARVTVVVLLGGLLLIDLTVDALLGFTWQPLAFTIGQNAMIFAFALWLAGKLLVVRADVLTFGVAVSQPPPAEPASMPDRDGALHRRLSSLIERDRIFLDPDLTFATFVDRMGAPEQKVRALVNRDLGYDHFRTFLNHHRVAEARRLLSEQGGSAKLIAIAHDSGFASLASFNRVFRAIEGRTPSDYRSAAKQQASRVPQEAQSKI